MRDRKGMDSDGKGSGEEPGGVDGGENVFRLYFMKKETMFNKGGNIPSIFKPPLSSVNENNNR